MAVCVFFVCFCVSQEGQNLKNFFLYRKKEKEQSLNTELNLKFIELAPGLGAAKIIMHINLNSFKKNLILIFCFSPVCFSALAFSCDHIDQQTNKNILVNLSRPRESTVCMCVEMNFRFKRIDQ